MDEEVRCYLVITAGFGGGEPRPAWYSHQGQAEYDVRRRLGVRRLHQAKRVLAMECQPAERTRIHEDYEWRCVWRYDLSKVPPSSVDYGRCPVVKLYAMVRSSPSR